MNYSKITLFFLAIAISSPGFASQELEKIDEEQGAYYTVAMPYFECKDYRYGKIKRGSIKLMARVGFMSKEIGSADFTYYPRNKQGKKEAYLSSLGVNPKYQCLGLGGYLFKQAMAHAQNTLDCELIFWMAYPSADPTPKGVARLVAFYNNAGSIDIDKNKTSSTNMHYPLPSAQMLTVMMPILEPKPLSKNEKEMVALPSGNLYNHSLSDALGIIANYMGEKNEDENKKTEVL